MNDDQFSIIVSKLDSILKLLAMNTVLGKNLREQVDILDSIGLERKLIANTLGKTPNHIGVVLHDLRKKVKQPGHE